MSRGKKRHELHPYVCNESPPAEREALAPHKSRIWQRKLNHEAHKDLDESIPCNFIFAVLAVFAVQLFYSGRFSGQGPPEAVVYLDGIKFV
jgi:hypothetical protein